jgi:hypothetical protein
MDAIKGIFTVAFWLFLVAMGKLLESLFKLVKGKKEGK